jgi:hypothetical protein
LSGPAAAFSRSTNLLCLSALICSSEDTLARRRLDGLGGALLEPVEGGGVDIFDSIITGLYRLFLIKYAF